MDGATWTEDANERECNVDNEGNDRTDRQGLESSVGYRSMSTQHASLHPLRPAIQLDGDGEHKLLWRKSPYPDNHVPNNFLASFKERQVSVTTHPSFTTHPLKDLSKTSQRPLSL
jgi:hypothetical protein